MNFPCCICALRRDTVSSGPSESSNATVAAQRADPTGPTFVPNLMRSIAASLLMLAVVIFAGCDNPSPISPTPPASNTVPFTPQPAPPGAPLWNWNLTTLFTGVTGPDNCFSQRQVRGGIPRSVEWQMEVTRTGNAVTFDYDVRNYPSDNVREIGTVDGHAFTARSVTWPISFPPCADGTVLSGSFDASVTGRFSDDGTHLTATEVWSYQFSSGEITFLMDWSADAREGLVRAVTLAASGLRSTAVVGFRVTR